jgi:hypothetical protein
MPRMPALYASAEELAEAETKLDLRALVTQGLRGATLEQLRYRNGQIESVLVQPGKSAEQHRAAIA